MSESEVHDDWEDVRVQDDVSLSIHGILRPLRLGSWSNADFTVSGRCELGFANGLA
jgi:hypothetical protein